MKADLRASSISAPLRTIFCGFSANGLKSFGLTAFPFLPVTNQNISFRIASATESRYGKLTR